MCIRDRASTVVAGRTTSARRRSVRSPATASTRTRPGPVRRVRVLAVAGERTDLLLADVVRPATTVDALAPGQRGEREERTVDRVGVEPVVGPGPHQNHRAPARLLRVRGEL